MSACKHICFVAQSRQECSYRLCAYALCIDNICLNYFKCSAADIIHPPDPFHLVVGFQRFRNALRICHLLYQPKKKRRLGITSKTALFCCGSERTLHGETAAEEIGVRPIPVWWRWRESNPRPKTGYRGFLRV